MTKVLISLAIVTLLTGSVFCQTMPARLRMFLSRNYPGWTITESFQVGQPRRPALVDGDFNGDGRRDYAVLITKGERIYAIALFETGGSYQAFNLLGQTREDRWIAGIDVAERNGEVFQSEDPSNPGKPIRLKTEAISLNDGEGMSQVFYWSGGRFRTGYIR